MAKGILTRESERFSVALSLRDRNAERFANVGGTIKVATLAKSVGLLRFGQIPPRSWRAWLRELAAGPPTRFARSAVN
jgi:hypothetical protein